ncbi:MAG: hypothetical protein ACON4H_02370, partial [Rubripirellula sp.]
PSFTGAGRRSWKGLGWTKEEERGQDVSLGQHGILVLATPFLTIEGSCKEVVDRGVIEDD